MKGCGKTAVGKITAGKLKIPFIDTDKLLEKKYSEKTGLGLSCREIFRKHGSKYFGRLEHLCLVDLTAGGTDNCVIACGGGTAIKKESLKLLKVLGKIFYLKQKGDVLYSRVIKNGIPAFVSASGDPEKIFLSILKRRERIYQKNSDAVIECAGKSARQIADLLLSHNYHTTVRGSYAK